ncbi:hypothetical protein KHQ81_14170 [Mycoplasmatota bacterium]|nr:hypothetical protein KHQ81_14170 [Mycoplasmatota bacterium]
MKEYTWLFLSQYTQEQHNNDNYLIIGIVIILIGLLAFKFPKFFGVLTTISGSWMYKDSTPSDEYISFIKILGVLGILVGIIFILDYFFA